MRTTDSGLSLYRRFLLIAGGVYLLWWFAVEAMLPNSFNPFLSRLVVSVIILGGLGLTFISHWAKRHVRSLLNVSLWLLTLHYFYLFYGNLGDQNWIVGCYITVIAVNQCFTSNAALLSYSGFVLALSLWLVAVIPFLAHSIFLPGLITIIIQANLGLRAQLKALRNLAESVESIRMRDEFISVASHELKTPLTSLKLRAQLLEGEIKKPSSPFTTPDRINGFAVFVNKQADKLNLLVETMLQVSRFSANQKIELRLENINLTALLGDVLSEIQIPELKIVAPEKLMIQGDRYRIEEVFENLLTNAKKYGEGRSIVVKAVAEDSQAVIRVEDHGIGIPADRIHKIFDRFERAVSSQNFSGLGLGLYIAHQIIQAHGGSITVDSVAGQGSTFTVRLPKVIDKSIEKTKGVS